MYSLGLVYAMDQPNSGEQLKIAPKQSDTNANEPKGPNMKYLIILTLLISSTACKRSGISGVKGFKAEPALAGKTGKSAQKAMKILGTSWEACIPYKDKTAPKCEKNQVCEKQTFFQVTMNLSKLFIMEVHTKNRFKDEYCTLKHSGYENMQETSEILAINDLKSKNSSSFQFVAMGSTDKGETETDIKLENVSSNSLLITSKLQALKGRNKMYKVQN